MAAGTKEVYSGFVGMYNFKGNLGSGHYSIVRLAEHVITKDHVAVKIIEKAKLEKVELEHLHCEVRVMKLLRNPNVIRLYQVVDTPSRLFLILELGTGGDLWERIKEKGKHNEQESRNILEQIVKALDYCHGHRVAHRDLKPENIVFCEDPETGGEVVKITDFGLSNQSDNEEAMMNTFCGSMVYSSPEVLLMEAYVGPMADVWSIGVLLYFVVCGFLPFQESTDSETLIKIMDVNYVCPTHCSAPLVDLISKILVKEPTDRLTGKEILVHPWVGCEVVPRRSKTGIAGAAGGGGGGASSSASGASEFDGTKGVGSHVNKVLHEQVVSILQSQAKITRAEVDEALKQKSYNYVASTYFLVAEQQKRRERDKWSGRISRPVSLAGNVPSLSTSLSLPEDGVMSPIPRSASINVQEPASSGKKSGQLRRRVPRPIDQDQLSQSMSSATSPQQYQHPATAGPLTMPPHLFGDLESLALSPRLPQHNGGRMPSLDQSWPGNGNSPAPGLSSTWNGEMMAQAVSGLDLDSTPGKHDPFPFPTSEPSSPGTPGELESLESRLLRALALEEDEADEDDDEEDVHLGAGIGSSTPLQNREERVRPLALGLTAMVEEEEEEEEEEN